MAGFTIISARRTTLEAAACERLFEASVAKIAAIAERDGEAREASFAAYREHYVSAVSRDATAASCPMVAFAGDVSRQSEGVRAAYAKGLGAYVEAFAKASGAERAEALRAFATLVGALTLARSVASSDPALSDEILAAARGQA